MILGAGVYQVPLIRRARERGLYTLAVSIPGNYPGFAWADRAVYLNTRDREAIVAEARREGAGRAAQNRGHRWVRHSSSSWNGTACT